MVGSLFGSVSGVIIGHFSGVSLGTLLGIAVVGATVATLRGGSLLVTKRGLSVRFWPSPSIGSLFGSVSGVIFGRFSGVSSGNVAGDCFFARAEQCR